MHGKQTWHAWRLVWMGLATWAHSSCNNVNISDHEDCMQRPQWVSLWMSLMNASYARDCASNTCAQQASPLTCTSDLRHDTCVGVTSDRYSARRSAMPMSGMSALRGAALPAVASTEGAGPQLRRGFCSIILQTGKNSMRNSNHQT